MLARSAAPLAPGAGVVSVGPGGAITHLAAASPLQLLTPRNHGRAAWIFAASFGGGLVDGDALDLAVDVAPGAAAYLSTQSSTKVYRGAASQALEVTVGAGGLFVAAPDPVVPFAGARYRQTAHVALAAGASLVWLDALSAGRAAHGERWAFARHESRLRVDRAGAPVALDALLLDPAHGPLPARLGRFAALATLLAVGPDVRPLTGHWLSHPQPTDPDSPIRLAASPLPDGALLRLAATSVQALLLALRTLLAPLPTLLGDDPQARRP